MAKKKKKDDNVLQLALLGMGLVYVTAYLSYKTMPKR